MKDKNELVITRVFDAPVAIVWKYWSEPEYMKKWWGPKDFTAPVVKIDFKVGGKILACMHGVGMPGTEAQDFWSTGTYKEIVPMKKIVVTDSFADENGNVVSAEKYGMPGFPMELLITITFEEKDGKTKMTLVHSGIAQLDEKTRQDMNQGWNQSFDKFAANL